MVRGAEPEEPRIRIELPGGSWMERTAEFGRCAVDVQDAA